MRAGADENNRLRIGQKPRRPPYPPADLTPAEFSEALRALVKRSAGVADLENHTIGYRGLRVVSC